MAGFAYYNEVDPYAAQWLWNLILAGHIAPGIVDQRSIEDVKPEEIAGFSQCHFFAGIGVWSLALRRAGWPDHRPIWTGSCPCQPFSTSGKKSGFVDERHLWPAWEWLIRECRPAAIAGEQVASKAAEPWLDLVQADLEAMGYAFGAVAFPAASVGAPHIRDRTYWVGYTNNEGSQGHAGNGGSEGRQGPSGPVAETGVSGGMADTSCKGPLPGAQRGIHSCEKGSRARDGEPQRPSTVERLADAQNQQLQQFASGRKTSGRRQMQAGSGRSSGGLADAGQQQRELQSDERPAGLQPQMHGAPATRDGPGAHSPGLRCDGPAGPTNGFWADADWLYCRDGKWRPVEPGTSPLAYGAPSRVGRLRAYGNAINAFQAQVFIEAVMEAGQ